MRSRWRRSAVRAGTLSSLAWPIAVRSTSWNRREQPTSRPGSRNMKLVCFLLMKLILFVRTSTFLARSSTYLANSLYLPFFPHLLWAMFPFRFLPGRIHHATSLIMAFAAPSFHNLNPCWLESWFALGRRRPWRPSFATSPRRESHRLQRCDRWFFHQYDRCSP